MFEPGKQITTGRIFLASLSYDRLTQRLRNPRHARVSTCKDHRWKIPGRGIGIQCRAICSWFTVIFCKIM